MFSLPVIVFVSDSGTEARVRHFLPTVESILSCFDIAVAVETTHRQAKIS